MPTPIQLWDKQSKTKITPKGKKHQNWNCRKDHRVTVIALDIATDPTRASNKEDIATPKQVKAKLLQH
jgi:hypothetical protein